MVVDIVNSVFSELQVGRCATDMKDALLMMNRIATSEDYPHLEIGVLHGASLIMAALVKKNIGHTSKAIGLDSLKGFYKIDEIDRFSGDEVSAENVIKNIEYFGVENNINLVRMNSFPWPKILEDEVFSTVYIDGDHWGNMPLNDWNSVKNRVVRYGIVFIDDNTKDTPSVLIAIKEASKEDGWNVLSKPSSRMFVIQKGDIK